jgi:hypothetical protein
VCHCVQYEEKARKFVKKGCKFLTSYEDSEIRRLKFVEDSATVKERESPLR